MKESKFKVRDIVRCIKYNGYRGIFMGEEYKVVEVYEPSLLVQDREGRPLRASSYLFELVESDLNKNETRLKSMYCYSKLPKALTLLSKLCSWGDSKHGVGPVKHDVDYKAKQQAHLVRYLSGEKLDRESKTDHRLCVAFNLLAEIETELKDIDLEELLK